MTTSTRTALRPSILLGGLLLLVIVGGLGVKFLERLMIYYPLGEHDFATPQTPLVPDDVYWTAKDGVRTHGWFLRHSESNKVLVYFHGNAGSIFGRFPWALQLMNAGVNVLMVEYRGYGRSEGDPDEQGFYLDAEAVWSWLTSEMNYEPSDIVLYGKSLGGGPASELALRYNPGALILQSTFTSIPDMAKRVVPFVPKFLVQTQFDTNHKLAKINAPTLIIHSRDDEIVPFEHSVENAQVAKNLTTHLVFEGYGHNTLVAGAGDRIVLAIRSLLYGDEVP